MSRKTNAQFHSPAETFLAQYHSSVIDEVSTTVQKHPVVVVGMAQNPFVGKARKLLKQNNIEFQYLEYGSYFSAWKPRLMIKIWSGWPTFPQVFVQGALLGGFDDLKASLEDGSFEKLLNATNDNE